MTDVLLAIGTAKGLVMARSGDRRSWQLSDLHLPMNGVYAVCIGTRAPRPRILVSADSSHWGPTVVHSDDLGMTWSEPEDAVIAFPGDTGAALTRVWSIADPHPGDASRITVAMSTGGVYRSADAGASWAPSNTGVRAYFLPDPLPEFGQCVHKVARDSATPERPGVSNAGRRTDLGCVDRRPAGRSLRQRGVARRHVRRRRAPAGIYVGTRAGEVYASADQGENWELIAAHLPDVLCVRAAAVP